MKKLVLGVGHRKKKLRWIKNYGQKRHFWLEWKKKLQLSGLKTTKVMQGRIKNTVKWKINYESYA